MTSSKLYENPGWDPKKERKNLQTKEQILKEKDNILAAFQARIISLGVKIKENPLLERDMRHLMDAAGRIVGRYYSKDGQKFLDSQMDEKTLVEALIEIQQFNLLTEKYI